MPCTTIARRSTIAGDVVREKGSMRGSPAGRGHSFSETRWRRCRRPVFYLPFPEPVSYSGSGVRPGVSRDDRGTLTGHVPSSDLVPEAAGACGHFANDEAGSGRGWRDVRVHVTPPL